MQIKEERIQELIAVYKKHYQIDLTHEQAWEILHRLMLLFDTLSKSDLPRKMMEKKEDPKLDDN